MLTTVAADGSVRRGADTAVGRYEPSAKGYEFERSFQNLVHWCLTSDPFL